MGIYISVKQLFTVQRNHIGHSSPSGHSFYGIKMSHEILAPLELLGMW